MASFNLSRRITVTKSKGADENVLTNATIKIGDKDAQHAINAALQKIATTKSIDGVNSLESLVEDTYSESTRK